MDASGERARSELGWDAEWQIAADTVRAGTTADGPIPGRVVRVDVGRATVLTDEGTVHAAQGDERAATGDWVLIAGDEPEDCRVVAVLPRRTTFVRGDPMEGVARGPQVVAANVDVVLVLHALTNGVNVRRLERELVLSFERGVTPLVVLTKADLVDAAAIDAAVAAAHTAARDIDVVVASAVSGAGLDELRASARPNRTIALIGASGVGKSTLINALVGRDAVATGDVRASDQRGRHTTTWRELVLLPGGGVLIDTPGLRAVSLWDADDGFSRVFSDIEALSAQCRFRDCSHRIEPGCAVRAAIERGELDASRFEHYQRLDAELDAQAGSS